MTIDITAKILTLLRPGAEWNIRGTKIEWLDKVQTQPTQAEMDAALANLQALDYQDLRAKEYPSVGDQLDAIWKGGQAATDMLLQVQAVKNKFPKP